MELQQMKYFKAVAEIGKISAAAESLYISAPALSTSIARLEKELGMPLFDRANNRIMLNKQGQIFLRYVNQMFNTLECARAELRQSMLQQGQHVSVATMTSNLWVDLITAFSQEYPQFTLSCANFRRAQLVSNGLPHQHSFLLAASEDLGPYPQSELESEPLFEDQLAVMVPPGHRLAKLETVTPEQLCQENLFLPLEGSALFERVCSMFESRELPVPTGHSYSYLVYRHMVEEGLGVSFTTVRSSRMEPGNLRYIPVEAGAPWILRLYWRRIRPLTQDEQCFKRFVENFYGLHKVQVKQTQQSANCNSGERVV